MLFKARGYKVAGVGEDTSSAVLQGGADPAGAPVLEVLLSVSKLSEQKHLFPFT